MSVSVYSNSDLIFLNIYFFFLLSRQVKSTHRLNMRTRSVHGASQKEFLVTVIQSISTLDDLVVVDFNFLVFNRLDHIV